ncbi:unnamed protein product [Onchocerca ochengi]|uniref:HIT domain-containing protein n=1 Tax=Onchocerca ochengi TaxID=42157 RepID=A0A182ENM0_ONCOC|nr:unnamed protein product [Onchocerca ochengi]
MKITPLGMRNPTLCTTASTQLNVQTVEKDVIKELSSGYMLVRSIVGLMIAGSGDVTELCQNNISSQNLVYHNTIMEQLQTGMIEEVPHNDKVGVIHYLPHHEVWNPNKNTTYDASVYQKGYKSLNEFLQRGPVLLPI